MAPSSKSLRRGSGTEWWAGAIKLIMTLWKRCWSLASTTIWLGKAVQTGIWLGGTDLLRFNCSQRCSHGSALTIFLESSIWQEKICWVVIWCEWERSFLKTTTFSLLHLCYRMTTKSSWRFLGRNGTRRLSANLKITVKGKAFFWRAILRSYRKQQVMWILNKVVKKTLSIWWCNATWQSPILLMASSLT